MGAKGPAELGSHGGIKPGFFAEKGYL